MKKRVAKKPISEELFWELVKLERIIRKEAKTLPENFTPFTQKEHRWFLSLFRAGWEARGKLMREI